MSDTQTFAGEEERGCDFVSTDHGSERVMVTCHNWRRDQNTSVMLTPSQALLLADDLKRRAYLLITGAA